MEAGAISGNDLLSHCQETLGSIRSGVCLGYINGVADALMHSPVSRIRACVPRTGSVTQGQIQAIAVKWLEANPQKRHYTASALVAVALSKAFPCPKKP